MAIKVQGTTVVDDSRNAEVVTLSINGTPVTATPTELNILDGATVTTDELNILDGATVTAAELNKLDGATVTTVELNKLDGATVTTDELNILGGATVTTDELNILDGATVTTDELNILDGATVTTDELNILDGATVTTAELNKLDGATVTTAELNKLDGATVTTAELNKLDGATVTTNELNILAGTNVTTEELDFLSGVTSDVQTQIDNANTKATLTKSFTSGEISTIALSQAISAGAPVVSVTKEVPQTGFTSNTWDVASDGVNYERHDTAYSTTLTPSNATGDGTFTLGTGSFASTDVGKTIEGNGGEAVLTATDGSYILVTSFNDTSAIASGDWSMFASVFDATNGLKLSGVSGVSGVSGAYDITGAFYDSVSFSVGSEDTSPYSIAFKDDGTKMYMAGGSNDNVHQYTLSTAWDLSTASYDSVSFSVSSEDSQPHGIVFKDDGTKMYMLGAVSDNVYQYSLSTAWDLSTTSYDSVSFSVSSEDANPRDIAFKDDGTKMYMVGFDNDNVHQYTLSTAWDLSTASYDSVSFSVGSEDTSPYGIAFKDDGTKMYMVGPDNDNVHQYTLSTAWDLSTASYDSVSFSVGSEDIFPYDIAFKDDGTKMYIMGNYFENVYQYTLGVIFQPTAQYTPALTNFGGQIDSTDWTDINSMTADQAAGDGAVYYAVSTDGRTTWKVIDNTNGERSIVRDNAGTWQYNSNTTYGSETWTNATVNEEFYAIQEALSITQNQMDKTQLEAVTDANHYTLGDNLDLMIALYLGSESANIPSSDGVSINYDVQAKNEGAVLGTDYDFDFPANDVVRITSNATQNLKVRIV